MEDQSEDSFHKSVQLQDSIIRRLEIIGEAVKNIPDIIRDSYTDVEWKRIAGLRDILIHEYFGVDRVIIWDIITNKLPMLETQIRSIFKELKNK